MTTNLPLAAPRSGASLQADASGLLASGSGERFPVVDGIPVLLPDPEERARVAAADGSAAGGGTVSDFYNQERDHDLYCRSELPEQAEAILDWCERLGVTGPALEIGSGKGVLQGIVEPYTAFDYSLTALRKHVDPKHQRVCGTAEALPFESGSAGLILTVAALEHVPDAAAAFAEVDRVLRPGGVAYLCPAWHCVQYNCDGIPVRPYGDLPLRKKLVKASLPLRRTTLWKALGTLPGRIVRRAGWAVSGRGPTPMRFGRLDAEYETFWLSDSDACSRLDSHEGCLFFESRGYEVLSHPTPTKQVLAKHVAVVVRKPVHG